MGYLVDFTQLNNGIKMVYNGHNVFEYDPEKSNLNFIKHGIDFGEAQKIWLSPYVEIPARTIDELRWLVIGSIDGVFWSSVITKRAGKIRIISVRRSRNEEKKAYQDFAHG